MANKIPSWCPDAIPTSYGWAHPLTGEQLVSHNELEDPIPYYIPNAGPQSFISPESEVRTVLHSLVRGRKVVLQVLSLEKITAVSWTIGSEVISGGACLTHTFSEDGLYSVYGEVSVEIDGEPDVVYVAANVRIGVAPPVVAPDIESVSVHGGEDSDQPVSVGLVANAVTYFNGTPDFNDMVFTYQWKKDGVDIATSGNYTPVEEDEGAMLSVTVTVTNSAGSDTATSPEVEVLPAV